MVMNIGQLKSVFYQPIIDEIYTDKQQIALIPLKVIIYDLDTDSLKAS